MKEANLYFLPYETEPGLIYALGWTGRGIVIETHRDNLSQIAEYTSAEAVYCQDQLGLLEFTPVSSGAWGFAQALKPTGCQFRNGIAWECPFPAKPELELLYNHSTSLDLLFRSLLSASTALDPAEKQLTVVFNMLPAKQGMCGGHMDIRLTPALLAWLATQSEESLDNAPEAIHDASALLSMIPAPRFRDWQIRLMANYGYVFACSGAGLYPEYRLGPNGNSCLVTHNSGNPISQLEMLAGVAAIDQLARRSRRSK